MGSAAPGAGGGSVLGVTGGRVWFVLPAVGPGLSGRQWLRSCGVGGGPAATADGEWAAAAGGQTWHIQAGVWVGVALILAVTVHLEILDLCCLRRFCEVQHGDVYLLCGELLVFIFPCFLQSALHFSLIFCILSTQVMSFLGHKLICTTASVRGAVKR